MHEEPPTRRDLLLAGGGTAAAGALAGCLGILGGDGGGDGGDGGGVDPPEYANWFYDPAAIEGQNRYAFTRFELGTLRSNREALGEDVVDTLSDILAGPVTDVGADAAAVDRAVFLSDSVDAPAPSIHAGSVDADAVATTLEDRGFSQATEHRGYRIYVGPDGGVGFGLGSAGVLRTPGTGEEAVQSILEAMVDARTGNGDRYVDANEGLRHLTASVGERLYVTGDPHERYVETSTDASDPRFAGEVANGRRVALDGEDAAVAYLVVFDGTDSVDVGAVEEWAQAAQEDGLFARASDVSTSRDGRVVTVSGTVDPRVVFQ